MCNFAKKLCPGLSLFRKHVIVNHTKTPKVRLQYLCKNITEFSNHDLYFSTVSKWREHTVYKTGQQLGFGFRDFVPSHCITYTPTEPFFTHTLTGTHTHRNTHKHTQTHSHTQRYTHTNTHTVTHKSPHLRNTGSLFLVDMSIA